MRSAVVVVVTCCWALSAWSQDAPVDAAAPPAAVIVPPELIADAPANYPSDAVIEGVHGPVVMDVDLDDDGRILRVAVTSSPDPRLTWAALGALTNFELLPAKEVVDGVERALAVRFSYTLTFTIDEVERERLLDEVEARRLAMQKATASVNLTGRVIIAGEKATVSGAVVSVAGTELEAFTDGDGNFSLRGVPEGKREIVVDAPGFLEGTVFEEIKANIATDIVIYVEKKPGRSDETVIRERRTQREVTKRVLTHKELTRVPGTFGDAIRVVQRLPGVSRAPFGLGAVLVRGGSPEDSTVLIDGHVARYLFHLGAGPSVINTDLVDRLEFYPGGQGARFGRAIAGAIDVVTRDPEPEFAARATVDLLSTGFRLEGPLTEDKKLALFVAGRTSYVAEILNIGALISEFVDEDVNLLTLAPRYADYQAKLLWKMPPLPGLQQSLTVSAFGAHDSLDLALDASNLGPAAPSNVGITQGFHRFNPVYKVRSNDVNDGGEPTWRAYVSPLVETNYSENRFDVSQFRLDVRRWALRAEVEYRPIKDLGFAFGTDDGYADFLSTVDIPFFLPDERLFPRPATSDPPRFLAEDLVIGTGSSFYVDSDLHIGPLTLLIGGRADLFTYYDEKRTSFDPRFAARMEVLPFTTLKANVGLYHQIPIPFFIAENGGNPKLPLEEGWQTGFGIETWLTRSVDVDAQVFYRFADQLAEPVGSPIAFLTASGPRIQPIGHERAFGAELLIRQRLDEGLFGWVSYTLMRSEERADKPQGVDDAEEIGWRSTEFDQTHNFSVAASAQLPWGFEVGGAVRYVTGNPATLAQGSLFDADDSRYDRVNQPSRSQRLPPFFQVDARIDKRFVFDTWALGLYLDLQNASNASNFEFFQYNYDFTVIQGFPGLPILPVFGAEASF
ncbi:MAG: TonB-dependent receptor plug domain-containing protein [Deltaproteobacteria bacterium]|nr:TonB-dependent receptor plug domain-containing protein [Deltaproteobacteria bacterium]